MKRKFEVIVNECSCCLGSDPCWMPSDAGATNAAICSCVCGRGSQGGTKTHLKSTIVGVGGPSCYPCGHNKIAGSTTLRFPSSPHYRETLKW